MKKLSVGLCILALVAVGTHANAAVLGIDSVTLDGADALLTATIGGVPYSGGMIASSAEDNRGGAFGVAFDSAAPLAAGTLAPTGSPVSVADVAQGMAFDNSVKTGVAGSTSSGQNGGAMSLRWHGGFMTDNDANPDFFVFEDLGNDSIVVHAILADGTLGAGLALSGWNTLFTDGVLGTNPSGGTVTGRTITGVAFDFTDLLDASGANLTNGTVIRGVILGDTGAADLYEVYGHVDIPEPATMVLLGLGGLTALRTRKRNAFA